MKFKNVFLVLLVIPLLTKGQINYTVNPIKAYFTFYKNGKSIHILNDSIKTSLYKFNETDFALKFYVNGKYKKQCLCYFNGIETKDSVRYLVNSNGKRYFKSRERILRRLYLKDTTCVSFLPESLFWKSLD